jgi:hypothetical protein
LSCLDFELTARILERGLLGTGGTGVATDDCHYPGHDSLLAWTMVRAESRDQEDVRELFLSRASIPDRSIPDRG